MDTIYASKTEYARRLINRLNLLALILTSLSFLDNVDVGVTVVPDSVKKEIRKTVFAVGKR